MYIVKALDTARGKIRPNKEVSWVAGDIRKVDDSEIKHYQNNPSVFTILSGDSFPDVPYSATMAGAYIDFNLTAESGMTITIDGVVYTEDDTAVPATGVFTNGASAADSATSLLGALNGDLRADVPFTAIISVSGDGVWLLWDVQGDDGNVTITTDSAGACTVQNSTGGSDDATKESTNLLHTVNTQELLAGAIELPLPFVPTGFHVSAFTSAGVPVYFTDTVEISTSPNRLTITTAGAINLADTDVLAITVFN